MGALDQSHPGRAAAEPEQSPETRVARVTAALARAPEWIAATATAVAALLAGVGALHLWYGDLHVPFAYAGDSESALQIVKTIIDTGWYSTNSALGAPLGEQWYDYPLGGDNLSLAVIRVLAVGSHDAALVANLFFLLTFPATALSAYLVMRRLSVSRLASAVAAVIYSTTPFHLHRQEVHMFLSAYYAAPIGCYLAIQAYGGRLRLRPASPRVARSWLPLASVVALAAVVGSGGAYFAVFSVILIAVLGALAALRDRSLASLGSALVVCGLVGGTLALNTLPSTLYSRDHGSNPVAAHRAAEESEAYGLKLASLVLPVQGHRIAPLARLRATYESARGSAVAGSSTEPLGALGTLGLLTLLIVVPGLSLAAGRARPPLVERLGPLSIAALVAFGTATIGGASALIANFVSPQVRVWERMSLLLAFLSLAAAAMLLDAMAGRIRLLGRPLVRAGVFATVLVLAFLDQTTDAWIPPYASIKAQWQSDAAFGQTLMHELPRGTAIYQLPYVPFPEAPPPSPQAGPYTEVRGYLHTSGLRWSFGAMRGRPGDIGADLEDVPLERQVPALVAGGFRAFWVDNLAYADHGAAERGALAHILAGPSRTSRDGHFTVFDARPYAAALRQRLGDARWSVLQAAVQHPVAFTWSTGAYDAEASPGGSLRWLRGHARIVVTNLGGTSRRVELDATAKVLSSRPASVDVSTPTGRVAQAAATAGGAPLHVVVEAPPGSSWIDIDSDAPRVPAVADRDLRLQLVQPRLFDAALG